MNKLKFKISMKLHAIYCLYCYQRVKFFSSQLINEIDEYLKKTKSTGIKYSTIWELINNLKKNKPNKVLELGSGLSTLIICHVMNKIHIDNNYSFISMENNLDYLDMARELLPEKYKSKVRFCLSKVEIKFFMFFRGYSYIDIPPEDYDFIFVDGPDYNDKYGSSICIDPILIGSKSFKKVRGTIDKRLTTIFAMQTLFKNNKLRYYSFKRSASFEICKPNLCNKIIKTYNFSSNLLGKIKLDI
mgnify:CR=1 FL=1|tara:strand:+ start:148 stop:879 length:732 start_codon:yes stop_codon:yes gene_type:complete